VRWAGVLGLCSPSGVLAPDPGAGHMGGMRQSAGVRMSFRCDNSWVRDLPGTFLSVQPAPAPAPRLLALNRGLAEGLGIDPDWLAEVAAEVLSGRALPEGADPVAQAYAGHQFGGFSPQLGDGRALLLGEVVDPEGWRWDVQLKGSGRTPFSRAGDGKAAVGPMLREYVMGEAMAALGIPTTRALAVVATGAPVLRETGRAWRQVISASARSSSLPRGRIRRGCGPWRITPSRGITRRRPWRTIPTSRCLTRSRRRRRG